MIKAQWRRVWSRARPPPSTRAAGPSFWREDLLQATERGLEEIADRVARGTLQGADQIGLAVGPAVKRYACKALRARDHRRHRHYARRSQQIHAKAALDGIYVAYQRLGQDAPNRGSRALYRGLEQVERAFGAFKPSRRGQCKPSFSDPPPPRRPCPCTCCSACGLLPHLAPAPSLGAAAIQDERPPDRSGPGRQGQPLYQRAAQVPELRRALHPDRQSCRCPSSIQAVVAAPARYTIINRPARRPGPWCSSSRASGKRYRQTAHLPAASPSSCPSGACS